MCLLGERENHIRNGSFVQVKEYLVIMAKSCNQRELFVNIADFQNFLLSATANWSQRLFFSLAAWPLTQW